MGETPKTAAVVKDMLNRIGNEPELEEEPSRRSCIGCSAFNLDGWPLINERPYCSQDCYEQRWERAMKRMGVPKRFWGSSFATMTAVPGIAQALQSAREFAETAKPDKGLFLYGSVGSGKTYLMAAIMRQRLEGGCSTDTMRFWAMLDLMAYIKREWGKDDRDPQRKLRDVALLFVDDLGMEIVRDWTYQEFLSLISHRYNAMLPTCLTSNLSHEEFLDRYGVALFSRISEMCDPVEITAPDYRLRGSP